MLRLRLRPGGDRPGRNGVAPPAEGEAFLAGRCKKPGCNYAHGEEELRSVNAIDNDIAPAQPPGIFCTRKGNGNLCYTFASPDLAAQSRAGRQ